MTIRRGRLPWRLSVFTALLLVCGCAATSSSDGGPDLASTLRSPSSTPGSPASGANPRSPSSAPVFAQPLRADLPKGAAGPSAAAESALDSLGAALLRQLPATENVVLSPYSIYAVLAMARAGAKGATAAQLDAVLGGDSAVQRGNVTAIDTAVAAALVAGSAPAGADPATTDTRPVSVDVANSVWLSPRLSVRPSFLDALATGFGVGIYKTDYAADPEAARKAINDWVGGHTKGLIPELLGQGIITPETVMTLVNALHLSAPWQDTFYPTSEPIQFTIEARLQSAAKAMSGTAELASASGSGWTSVTIPYRGSGLAMTVVLPDAGSFTAVRAQLPKVLESVSAAEPTGAVEVRMPIFKTATHLSLKPAMDALGVKNLFGPSADLSGIAGNPGDLMAGELVHQAVITVDEKGTEAAAATAMSISATAGIGGDIKRITVDRPFFYSIHDTKTGAPLFLGQVTDPTR
jgi:serpin B